VSVVFSCRVFFFWFKQSLLQDDGQHHFVEAVLRWAGRLRLEFWRLARQTPLSLVTNGTYEGIAIGGDRYPGSAFVNHLFRYERDPDCKMLVLLGEHGGIEEYHIIDTFKDGIIKKPIIAWANWDAREDARY
jgi:Succinyl-CoA synthetase, alpha subunit